MRAVGYGIDYGTSNSSIAVAYEDGTVEVLPVDASGDSTLRSLVHLHRDHGRLVGEEASRAYLIDGAQSSRCGTCALVDRRPEGVFTDCRQYRAGSGCQDSRLLAQIKTDLSSDAVDRTHSWGTEFTFVELVSAVLRRLKREGDRRTGQDVRRVAIGHPVRFPGTETDPERLQALAESRLRRAAEAAGFQEVVLVSEPQAAVALEGLHDGIVVCTDFGGGTFDVAVVDKLGNRGQVLGLRGIAVGGEDFDSRVFEAKLHRVLGLDRTVTGADGKPVGLPNWMRHELRSLAGLKRLLTDPSVAVLLRGVAARDGGDFAEGVSELLHGGQAYACYRAIEKAKIDLSEQEQTRIVLRRPPYLDIDVPLSRAEFEQLIAADVEKVSLCIQDVLDDADVRVEDVAHVTRTGGTSRTPAFQTLLEHTFGAERIVQRDAFTTVVRGLAVYAFHEWAAVAA